MYYKTSIRVVSIIVWVAQYGMKFKAGKGNTVQDEDEEGSKTGTITRHIRNEEGIYI